MPGSQSYANSRTWKRPTATQTKLLIGGFIVVLTVGYLILTAVRGGAAYYLTVEELKNQGPSPPNVRVAGIIVGQSIVWKARDLTLQFEIADQSGTLPVVYHGLRPDMFRDDAEAVIEGQYTSSGVFQAHTLLLKCPSKYDEATTGG